MNFIRNVADDHGGQNLLYKEVLLQNEFLALRASESLEKGLNVRRPMAPLEIADDALADHDALSASCLSDAHVKPSCAPQSCVTMVTFSSTPKASISAFVNGW